MPGGVFWEYLDGQCLSQLLKVGERWCLLFAKRHVRGRFHIENTALTSTFCGLACFSTASKFLDRQFNQLLHVTSEYTKLNILPWFFNQDTDKMRMEEKINNEKVKVKFTHVHSHIRSVRHLDVRCCTAVWRYSTSEEFWELKTHVFYSVFHSFADSWAFLLS